MKYYRIAGLLVAMDSFGRTEAQAAPYEVNEAGVPDIVMHSAPDLLQEHAPHLSFDECEYISSGSYFYTQLLNFEGIMIHSSCVVVDNKAYLFTAPSGTGKSTHTMLWLRQFGERAYILNDDKPALRLENGVWYAYGTPWSGKFDISCNVRVPVAGIALLERSEENEILPCDIREAVTFIMEQIVRPKSAAYRIQILDTLDKLFTQVPIWKLKCNMQHDAALVSYLTMSGQQEENQ